MVGFLQSRIMWYYMKKPEFLGDDFVAERMNVNGKVIDVWKPKETMSLEEFEKAIEPIIKEMAENKRIG